MRILFVLPAYIRVPVGGHKVVYEYANRLSSQGHELSIVHPRNWIPRTNAAGRVDTMLWRVRNRVLDRPLVPWFPINPAVRLLFTPDLRSKHLPDADIIVATSWNTASWVAEASAAKGRKFYFIQHYETWSGDSADVEATWSLPLNKIVVSSWLFDIAAGLGEENRTTLIPPGLDFDRFQIARPIEKRADRVGMLYHDSDWKGSHDGIAALERVRKARPHLSAVLFGIAPRPKRLPDWIEYVRSPPPKEHLALYNSCAIFLQPSWSEGWGLPATEAMMCGCALVTTDNGGSRDYAIDNETALVAPPKNPGALATRLLELLDDRELRASIALGGNAYVQQFTWSRAVDSVERAFKEPFGRLKAVPIRNSREEDLP